jgi:hypothetical protein
LKRKRSPKNNGDRKLDCEENDAISPRNWLPKIRKAINTKTNPNGGRTERAEEKRTGGGGTDKEKRRRWRHDRKEKQAPLLTGTNPSHADAKAEENASTLGMKAASEPASTDQKQRQSLILTLPETRERRKT